MHKSITDAMRKHKVAGGMLTITTTTSIAGSGCVGAPRFETVCLGQSASSGAPVTLSTLFEVASLSKAVAACFSVQYFQDHGISLCTSVNSLFERAGASYRITSAVGANSEWANEVTVAQLMNHTGLNMHYVNGIPLSTAMPTAGVLLSEGPQYGYGTVYVEKKPGTCFGYSGGGFLVLEHLLEVLEQKPISDITRPFLDAVGMTHFSFDQKVPHCDGSVFATGFTEDGMPVDGDAFGRRMHPALAAGGLGTSDDMARFLHALTVAYQNVDGYAGISHDTAIHMLDGRDLGSGAFMGACMGLGVFVGEAGPNRVASHQGANDGFRSLFVHCFQGPNAGTGFNMHVNAELNGVLFISEVAQLLFKQLAWSGVDLERFKHDFHLTADMPREQIVNMGYKQLVFDAFCADNPERPPVHGPLDELSAFNLAVEGRILAVTNQRFALASNLLSPYRPVFDPELFGRQGKVMDSWESVRHNQASCDALVFALPRPTAIHFAALSTEFHLGNQPQGVTVEGRIDSTDELATQGLRGESGWICIVPFVALDGHSLLRLRTATYTGADHDALFTHIRVRIYPDGGFSRLGLFNESLLPASHQALFSTVDQPQRLKWSESVPKTLKPLAPKFIASAESIKLRWATIDDMMQTNPRKHFLVDVASAAMGGSITRASNEHYGPAVQILSPFPPLSMFDGLESARSRMVGHFEDVSNIQVANVYF